MDHIHHLNDKKRSALQSITELKALALGASLEELSIINKLISVAQNNIKMAEIEHRCHMIIANASDQAA